ncbi:MAG: IclR family transcriptional regulator [Victivallaceae bacterium]
MAEKKKSLIQSLDRALDILEIVRDSSTPVRSTDIAQQLGLGIATAHNIIRSLYTRGYLAQDDNSRYVLGPECFKLCRVISDVFEDLRQVVKNHVQKLSENTGDTAFFGVEHHRSLYCISVSMGKGQLVVSDKQEWLEKMHCTAVGKIIIAERGIDWFEKLARQNPFKKFTGRTITSPAEMAAEIKGIKTSGYALSRDECSTGISALGIAVYDKNGKFVGALGQALPTAYLDSGEIIPEERVELLRATAKKIQNDL